LTPNLAAAADVSADRVDPGLLRSRAGAQHDVEVFDRHLDVFLTIDQQLRRGGLAKVSAKCKSVNFKVYANANAAHNNIADLIDGYKTGPPRMNHRDAHRVCPPPSLLVVAVRQSCGLLPHGQQGSHARPHSKPNLG
jgi:hypothetical protein